MHKLIRFLVVLGFLFIPALGSAENAASRRLLKRLSGRSEVTRLKALEEVQQSSHTLYQSMPVLIEATELACDELGSSDAVSISTASMIYALALIDRDQATESVIHLLDHDQSQIVAIAADALGQNKRKTAIGALSGLRMHPQFNSNYGFRYGIVRSLALMGTAQAYEILLDWRKGLDGQLLHDVDEILVTVDSGSFEDDVDRFNVWKQRLDEQQPSNLEAELSLPDLLNGKPSIEVDEGDSLNKTDEIGQIEFSSDRYSLPDKPIRLGKKRQYYGIELSAKRMIFVIDHSGSMKDYWNGITRLARAKTELNRVIESLEPDDEFGIVFFETDVRTWRDELLPATTENKKDAALFIRRLGYGDRTNTYGALLNCLNFDAQLEAVYLLTDGRPTEGRVIQPAAIINDIVQRNQFKHLNFNTIGIAVAGDTELFLKTLAEKTGGEFRIAD